MQKIRVIFTKRRFNPGSLLIRWVLPRSRFYLALSSHALIQDGEHFIDAHMLHGVRRSKESLKGLTVVKVVEFSVPDAAAGIEWARSQVGKPYDWPGALGLGLAPGRKWANPDKWFCYEFAAGAIVAAGRDAFASTAHVTESALLAIKP